VGHQILKTVSVVGFEKHLAILTNPTIRAICALWNALGVPSGIADKFLKNLDSDDQRGAKVYNKPK
jgi:hypothetical protein